MSYCRWSTNDFGCDLYVYASGDDTYTIHVANSRVVGKIPHVDDNLLINGDIEGFVKQHKAQLNWVMKCDRGQIDLPHAGETFVGDAKTTVSTLKMLKQTGYKFPDYVIHDIEKESETDE